MSRTKSHLVIAAAALTALPSTVPAGGTVDGARAAGEYAFTLGLQNTPTGFGDNISELNAAYADVLSDGSIRLMFTGNLELNGNTLTFFMDSRAGGGVASTVAGGYGVLGSVGGQRTDDWGTDIDGDVTITPTPGGGSILSPGFNPDISIEASTEGATSSYHVNVIDMTIPNEPLPNRDIYLGANPIGNPSVTHTYVREPGATPFGTVEHAFNNTNTGGVLGYDFGNPPGPLGNPADATTGLEMSLSSLFVNADPLEEIRIMPFISNGGGDYLSNQFLPGVNGLTNLAEAGSGPGGKPLFDVRTMSNSETSYLTVPLPTYNTVVPNAWENDNNWTSRHHPNGVNVSAVMAAPGAIPITTPITLGGLSFRSTSITNLVGASPITLDTHPRFDGTARPARLDVTVGGHAILTPMIWNQNVRVTVASGSNLNVSGMVTVAPGKGMVKQGGGAFSMTRLRMAAVDILEGTVRVTTNVTNNLPAKLSVIDTLTFAQAVDTGTPAARLDLTNNSMVISTPPPIDEIRQLIQIGYSGGAWSGNGIVTSNGTAGQLGLAYATAGAVGISDFLNQPVNPDDILIRFGHYGDANLDGMVNLNDYNRLAANFNQPGRWDQGDFTYDGLVNLADFNRLTANFNLSAGPDGPTPEDWAALAAAIPEPSGTALVGLVMAPLLRRRRS